MQDNSVFIHKTSIVNRNVKLGVNTRVWQFCNIMNNVIIGDNCNIGQNVFIENGVIIGNNVKIKNNISIYTGVICEDDVFLGPACVFTNVLNPRSFIERKSEFKQTIIKRGASIGANSTIICGNTIGRYAMVAAGAVVTRDVPDYALVMGNPGKIAGYVCKCGEKLIITKKKIYCGKCKAKYILNKNNVLEEIL